MSKKQASSPSKSEVDALSSQVASLVDRVAELEVKIDTLRALIASNLGVSA